MPRLKIGALAVALVALAGCDGSPGRQCAAVAVRKGVGLEIEPPMAAKVSGATMRICWDGVCRTPRIRLDPSSESVPQGCTGDGPDAACGATASPTGGKNGFADVSDLPNKPLQVTVRLRDAAGKRLLDRRITVTPELSHPDGPECGGATPQARLTVTGTRLHT